MPRKFQGKTSDLVNRSEKGKKNLFAPFHFRHLKTSFYQSSWQLQILSLILQGTGLRIKEVLSLKKTDLLGNGQVHIKSLKRSRERVITLDGYLYNLLEKQNNHKEKIFTEPYFRIYKYIKSGQTGMPLIKNSKNFSICHSARKHYIRNQLYNLKKTVSEISLHIGWQKKTSIVYYL